MFNSIFREFDEDPFFRDPFQAHRDHMQHLMRSLSEPFGRSPMPRLMDGGNHDGRLAPPSHSSQSLNNDHRDLRRNPFEMVDNMMASMRNRMNMPNDFENGNSSGHSFSSSSVMTYSKVGNEPPKVFQASSSTRRAPGGIKETRRAIKDSESGLEKMSIGHHIQDRGHVMEKKLNNKTGIREFNQDFQNLDETEAEAFDEEWRKEVSKFKVDAFRSHEPRSITFNQDQGHREQHQVTKKRESSSKKP